jgi:hypothetical protein
MQPHEIDITVNLFAQYYDQLVENNNDNLSYYDENSVIETIRNYTIRQQLVWLNAYEGQRPVGFIAGSFGPCLWNKQITKAHIDFVFLLPGRNMQELINAFTEHAHAMDAREIILTDMNTKVNQPIFENLGFRGIQLMTKEISK